MLSNFILQKISKKTTFSLEKHQNLKKTNSLSISPYKNKIFSKRNKYKKVKIYLPKK